MSGVEGQEQQLGGLSIQIPTGDQGTGHQPSNSNGTVTISAQDLQTLVQVSKQNAEINQLQQAELLSLKEQVRMLEQHHQTAENEVETTNSLLGYNFGDDVACSTQITRLFPIQKAIRKAISLADSRPEISRQYMEEANRACEFAMVAVKVAFDCIKMGDKYTLSRAWAIAQAYWDRIMFEYKQYPANYAGFCFLQVHAKLLSKVKLDFPPDRANRPPPPPPRMFNNNGRSQPYGKRSFQQAEQAPQQSQSSVFPSKAQRLHEKAKFSKANPGATHE